MYILLFYFLITFSYHQLESSITIEAKTPSDGFTVDLIHRYSPKSPFHNSSMTLQDRLLRLARHSSLRLLQFKRLKETSKTFDSNLIPNNGDYLMKISIGMPPVDLFVIADTGSGLIWVQCKPCDHCYPQSTKMFDPKQSSTFATLPRDSPNCRPEIGYGTASGECQYVYAYGNGSTMASGIMVTDMFTFTSTDHKQDVNSSIVFGCGFDQEGNFDEDAAGVVGLSGERVSLISQLGSSIANRFSYCLTPTTSNFTSKLRLGTHVEDKQRAVTTPLLSQYLSTFYAISLKGISIGKRRVEVEKDILIDSGSTLTYIDPGVYSNLEEAVKDAIIAKPIAQPPLPELSLCYDKKSAFRAPANMSFHLNEGDILLNTTNFFIDFGDFVCLAIVPSEDDDPMILGNVAQVNFEVEFDLERKMVSFTPTSCVHEDSAG